LKLVFDKQLRSVHALLAFCVSHRMMKEVAKVLAVSCHTAV